MRLSILKHLRFFSIPKPDEAVAQDADDLIQLWGNAAYQRATYLSWEEDIGIVASSRPGHWWRVRREIGRRLDQHDSEPRAEFAA